jgi:hypothetical protein
MSNNNQNSQNNEEVNVTADDQEFIRSVEQGVMSDDHDYKKLFFWTTFIISMVAIFLVALIELYDYSSYVLNEKTQEVATYTEIQELNAEGTKQLNSFGVANAEQNTYHIPIDSAIHIMAQDSTR